ncbi:hypothetical protein RL73_06300 [Liberibacter crescens]|nr:hypothetical protein RL73_06300 [Liberibacter crescens]
MNAFLSFFFSGSFLLISLTSTSFASPQYSSIVIDAKNGNVLYSFEGDSLRYPASLTKMMTLYIIFEALEEKRLNLNTKIPVSAKAASEPPSKLGLKAGSTFTVQEGILALITRSANDVATAFGEFLGKSEKKFAKIMTAKARKIGMKKTVYKNANGLPDKDQVTTSHDQTRLGIVLRKRFPQYYRYFSTHNFHYKNQVIPNHNHLIGQLPGIDGIKTGYTKDSGFNVVSSIEADGRSIVAAVMGKKSSKERDQKMLELITTYLPKAYKEDNNTLRSSKSVASANTKKMLTKQEFIAQPTNVPIPKMRNKEKSIQIADSKNFKEKLYEAPTNTENAILADISDIPIPAYAPELYNNSAEKTISNIINENYDISSSKWIIQIGIASNKKEAMDLLQSVQAKGGKTLLSAIPFTSAISDGKKEIYRARFKGFKNQKSALNSCNALKKRKISCWVSGNTQ